MEGCRTAVQNRRLILVNRIFADLPNTIFDVMSQAARDLKAINLGQGFPEDPGPLDVREKAADAVLNGYNQYPSMMGIPELRQAIATHYAHWHGLQLDPMSEVMVTSGATEALTGSILGLLQPGDEVLLFQPMYDSYVPIIRLAGGIPKFLRLEPPYWRLPEHAPARYCLHLTMRFSKGRKTAPNPIESVTEMSIAPIRQPWCNPARIAACNGSTLPGTL